MSTLFESESEPDSGGIIDSIHRLGNSLTGLLHTRAELFAVELQEEKLRAIRLLVWVAVAITLGVAGLLVVIIGLALFFWEMAGYWGLAGFAAGSLGLAATILWIVHRRITRGPAPFAGTVAEFRKDAECLRK
jgi:uncharacterized membrane protein YqjE